MRHENHGTRKTDRRRRPDLSAGAELETLLRDVAENRAVGDVATFADSSVMDLIAKGLSK